jgi:hypothetical protein
MRDTRDRNVIVPFVPTGQRLPTQWRADIPVRFSLQEAGWKTRSPLRVGKPALRCLVAAD